MATLLLELLPGAPVDDHGVCSCMPDHPIVQLLEHAEMQSFIDTHLKLIGFVANRVVQSEGKRMVIILWGSVGSFSGRSRERRVVSISKI